MKSRKEMIRMVIEAFNLYAHEVDCSREIPMSFSYVQKIKTDVIAALAERTEGLSEEERKDLIDHFDWLRRLCNEDIYSCLFCKRIRAFILGSPAPGEEVRDERP